VIHNHKIVHKQEKVKLFRLGDEDLYFRAGKKKKIKPFEIEGVKYAILICFELRFKELWKQIEGADVVLVVARWGLARKEHLEILSRSLAIMNQCYVLVSNSSDSDMASSSAVISPMGDITINDDLSAIEETIDFREIKKMRRYIVMD
jgi:predicted amidohydrolase